MNGKSADLAKARQRATRLLARRAYSEAGLRAKLLEKGFGASVVGCVIDEFRERRYLDDGAFAAGRARTLAEGRLYGDRRIFLSLRDKGVSEEEIRKALAGVRREIGEAEAIRRWLAKRDRLVPGAARDPAERRKIVQSLMRRGFPLDRIFQTLANVQEDEIHVDEGQ